MNFQKTQLVQFQEMLGAVRDLPEFTSALRLRPGTVIADLYLPYMCCSECAPTAFILAPGKDELTEVNLSIEQKTFCNTDESKYPVNVNPQNAEVKGKGIINQDGAYFFTPFGLGEAEYSIEASAGNGSDRVTVSVFAPADTGFQYVIKSQSNDQFVVQFIPDFQGGFHAWQFGDDSEASHLVSPEHTYFLQGERNSFEVIHSVAHGVCGRAETARKIEIQTAPAEDIALSIQRKELCSNDEPEILIYSPEGGIMVCVENSSAIVSRNGKYYFDPQNAGVGRFTVRYSTANNVAQIEIFVREAHSAAFKYEEINQDRQSITYRFKPNAQFGHHIWEFSDGQKSEEIEPEIKFEFSPQKPFRVTATHTLNNGICKDSISEEIKKETTDEIEERKICYSHKEPVMLTTGLPADSSVKPQNTGSHSLDERGQLYLSPTTPVGLSEEQISYTISGPQGIIQKRIRLVIYRIDTQIEIKLEREGKIHFRSLEPKLKVINWKIEGFARDGQLVFNLEGSGNPLSNDPIEKWDSVFRINISAQLSVDECNDLVEKVLNNQQVRKLKDNKPITI